MKGIVVLLFSVVILSSKSDGGQLRQCLEDDICEAIVFNQLALAAVQEEMKNLMKAVNLTRGSENPVRQEDYDRCLNLNQDLRSQISSLEKKNQEVMMRHRGQSDEKDQLHQKLGDADRVQRELQDRVTRLEEVVSHQEELIKNLTVISIRPVDCADIQNQGQTESGIYTIYPTKTDKSIEVLCDLQSNGGGWTTFMTRQPQDEPLDFNESWDSFKDGFGNINTEHWLGNDVMHVLTSYGTSSLRVDAEIFTGERRWAEWNIFGIGDEETKYRLTIDQYQASSSMGDSLSRNNNSSFTTFDDDNDSRSDLNCAVGTSFASWGKGGWWYKSCGSARPTAPLMNTNFWDSACWLNWNTTGTSLVSFKTLSMKFRRWNYEELTVNEV